MINLINNNMQATKEIQERLDYLRQEIEAERISYGEIAELQSLADYIPDGDMLLLQWAGVPEFPDQDIINQELLAETKEFFKLASIDRDLLLFELDNNWLTVSFKEPLNAMPSNDPKNSYKYSLICAQNINEYANAKELVNRITLIMADKIASQRQDINILMSEYTLIKKPLINL